MKSLKEDWALSMASNPSFLTEPLPPSPPYEHANLKVTCKDRFVQFFLLPPKAKQMLQLLTITETMTAVFILLNSVINLVKTPDEYVYNINERSYEYGIYVGTFCIGFTSTFGFIIAGFPCEGN